MLVRPLGRSRHRPPVLLAPGWRSVVAYTPDGERVAHGPARCFQLLAELQGAALYVHHSLRSMLRTTGARAWSAETWKGRATSVTLEGTRARVVSLRRSLNPADDPATRYEHLTEATDWLGARGVAPGSLSAMAWSLWRSSLHDAVEVAADPKVTRPAFYGPRQEARPGRGYRDHVMVDIVRAYPHSMAARPFAGLIREVSALTRLDPDAAGIARATVTVPADLDYPPLPIRLGPAMIHWRVGELTGAWTWQELVAARRLGCDVTVTRCWAPLTELDLFGPWFGVLERAHAELSPGALSLIKPVANALWGLFGMSGDVRTTIRWRDDAGDDSVVIAKAPRRLPQATTVHVAAEVTARVRTRMLLEGLHGELDGVGVAANSPVHVDTDGMIVPARALLPLSARTLGPAPGQWRVKSEMRSLEVRAPQLYRYTTPGTSEWNYVAAGLAGRSAADLFTRLPRIAVSIDGIDAVAPSGAAPSSRDVADWAHQRAKGELALWGPLVTDA